MIKVKVNKGKARITVKGERFETANEAVNIAVGMAEHFEKIDPAMGYAIRKTIIDALSGNLPELEKEEPKEEPEAAEVNERA